MLIPSMFSVVGMAVFIVSFRGYDHHDCHLQVEISICDLGFFNLSATVDLWILEVPQINWPVFKALCVLDCLLNKWYVDVTLGWGDHISIVAI